MSGYVFFSFIINILFFTLMAFVACTPLRLNNSSDPASRDFLLTVFLNTFRNVSTITFSSSNLLAETGITTSSTANPDRSDLRDCRSEPSLPSYWSLTTDGKLIGISTPYATLPKTDFKIRCGISEYGGLSAGTISLETKGIDWVKNFTATGPSLSSSIYNIAILNPKELLCLRS